jgi:hypothetical protein
MSLVLSQNYGFSAGGLVPTACDLRASSRRQRLGAIRCRCCRIGAVQRAALSWHRPAGSGAAEIGEKPRLRMEAA